MADKKELNISEEQVTEAVESALKQAEGEGVAADDGIEINFSRCHSDATL